MSTAGRPGPRTVVHGAELATLLDEARSSGRTVGLVPTMGALHAGHRSLIARAVSECDVAVVTIFVNPLQFGDASDIEHYPRDLAGDLVVCADAGATVVFAPSVPEMYPGWPAPVATTVSVAGRTEAWEGAARPGHFDGVTTVVAKLFALAGRCRAYFGEKDFQQLAVVRQMAADLSLPVEVVACPTVREDDGLALSSRNVRLSVDERRSAVVLSRALAAGRRAVADGGSVAQVVERMSSVVDTEPAVRLDYAAVVDPVTLTVPEVVTAEQPWRLLIAAQVGPVRLIDNCEARVSALAGRTTASTAAR